MELDSLFCGIMREGCWIGIIPVMVSELVVDACNEYPETNCGTG